MNLETGYSFKQIETILRRSLLRFYTGLSWPLYILQYIFSACHPEYLIVGHRILSSMIIYLCRFAQILENPLESYDLAHVSVLFILSSFLGS